MRIWETDTGDRMTSSDHV